MQGQDKHASRGSEAISRDPMLRLKRFALVLSGDEARAEQLVARLAGERDLPRPGEVPQGTLQFLQFKRLYEIWSGIERAKPSAASLFAPGNANEAIRKGLDPQIASIMERLPSQHRIMLLLVYGEDYSYAATASMLNVSIEQLMMALTRARLQFATSDGRVMHRDESGAALRGKAVHDAA